MNHLLYNLRYTFHTMSYDYWPSHLPKLLSIPETSVYHNLKTTAERFPHKKAVSCNNISLTYKELLSHIKQLAGYLHSKEVSYGDRVIIQLQSGFEWIIAAHACWHLGAIVVPISPALQKNEQDLIIHDSGAKIAIVKEENYQNSEHHLLQHQIIVINDGKININEYDITWEEVLHYSCLAQEFQATTNDLCMLPYTSGSTGKPKACMHTHGSVQANITGGVLWSELCSESVCLATMPFFHVTGFINSLMAPLSVGATIEIMPRWNKQSAAYLISQASVTHWSAISTMIIDLLSLEDLEIGQLSTLQRLSGGGAALPKAIGERLKKELGLSYLEGYGLTETMAQTHLNPKQRPKLQCLGIPYFNTFSYIRDPETGELLSDGQIGEIVIHGKQLMTGYWNQCNEDTFIMIDGLRFLRTGDLGYRDHEGYYFLVDRIKRMINVSGMKVWPAEIEAILLRHQAIQEVCVISVPDERTGEKVQALVVLQPSFSLRSEELHAWCLEQMASYKVPKEYRFVASLPRTSTGKIAWRFLQEQAAQEKTTKQ